MSSGVSFASLIAARITRYAPSPFSAGWVMWYASPDIPYPTISARIGALRLRACSSDSRIRIPAPSPTTKPSRPASHGRLALAGSSLRVVRNPNMSRGQIHNRGGNKERRNLAGPALYQFDVFALDDIEPADAR